MRKIWVHSLVVNQRIALLQVHTLPPPSGLLHQTATARASLSSFRYARFPLLQVSCTKRPQHGRVCPPSGTHASPSFRSPAPNGHSTGESVLLQVRTLPPPSGLLHQTATARASLSSFRYARFPLLQVSCTKRPQHGRVCPPSGTHASPSFRSPAPNGHSTGESVLLQVRTLPPPSGLLHQTATARASLSSFRYARFPLLQVS